MAPVSSAPQELKEPPAPKPSNADKSSSAAPAAQPKTEAAKEKPKAEAKDDGTAAVTPSATKKHFPRSEAFENAKKAIPEETHKRLSDLLRADFKYLEELSD